MTKDASAPGALELVRSFVNSIDLERPETLDALADLGAARLWLADVGLDPAGLALAELEGLRELREALRGVLLAHNGDGSLEEAWPRLARCLEGVRILVSFERTSDVELVPTERTGAQGLREAIAVAIYDSKRDGSWQRLKACRKHSCLYAFYDKTKNGSGAW